MSDIADVEMEYLAAAFRQCAFAIEHETIRMRRGGRVRGIWLEGEHPETRLIVAWHNDTGDHRASFGVSDQTDFGAPPGERLSAEGFATLVWANVYP